MADGIVATDIGLEPLMNFDDKDNIRVVIKNGSPELVSGLEAIRQWIVKFCMTEKDTYSVYDGTGFGCRLRSLYGRKRVGYGYEEAEIERDFREGLPLCPGISNVTNFVLNKVGKVLNISIEVELTDGGLLDVSVEKVFIVGGF